MSLSAMRWVDHWLGIPICLILGYSSRVVRKLFRIKAQQPDLTRPVAVLKFFGIGSLVQASPLLRTLRDRHPGARVILVTFESNAPLLKLLNVCTDLRIIRTSSPFLFARDVIMTVIWLRKHRVGVSIDLEFFSKFSTLLSFLSGAPVRIAFHLNDFWRCAVVTDAIYYNYYRHISELYAQAAERVGLQVHDQRMSRIEPSPDARRYVVQFLAERGLNENTRLVGVNVNAGELSLERRWPPDRFARLIENVLARSPENMVLLTGSGRERGYVSSVEEQVSAQMRSRVINGSGVLSLEQFVAALERVAVYVTNDSGPMHLAAAQGVPLVSLWGPGRPDFYAPKAENHVTIYERFTCSPCLYMFTTFEGMWCNHEGWCMQAIEVSTVLNAIKVLLKKEPVAREEFLPNGTTGPKS